MFETDPSRQIPVDITLSTELIDIYRQEVAERSRRLANAAVSLREGAIDPDFVADLIRDAHTIKGSSRVVGRPEVAAAAHFLEHVWKRYESSDLQVTEELSKALEALAGFLPDAAQQEAAGLTAKLRANVARAESALAGNIYLPVTPALAPPTSSQPSAHSSSLGGLLAEVERSVMSGVSRVDTMDLYQLINQAVEVSLDAESLSDLALVQLEGADPTKLMAAWRQQLRRMAGAIGNLQSMAVNLANAQLSTITDTFPQFVRYMGRKLKKEVRFESSGEEIELDRQIVELLREPLRHLLVNAVDHGLETPEERSMQGKPTTGIVSLNARREGEKVVIVVSDDGRGIDWKAVQDAAIARGIPADEDDLSPLLFTAGFSTLTEAHDFSGLGEGLPAVADVSERVNGIIQLETVPGLGTSVTVILPISLVLQNVVVLADGPNFWGIPEAAVQASIVPSIADVVEHEGSRRARFQTQDLPVVSMAAAMGREATGPENDLLIVSTRSGPVAVSAGEVLGKRRVAVKALGPILGGSRSITGAALLGGGEVLVVVDPNYLGEYSRQLHPISETAPRVLVVDDSAGVRQLISASLAGRGFEVEVAEGAREAAAKLASAKFECLVVDFAMPRSNGVELVRALRAAGVTIPMVMVSGVADAEQQQAAWDAGVNAYLEKNDLRLGSLASTVRALLEGQDTQGPP
ncbi:MAG: response regulator [Acidimicrobiia bacterium]|nr:response regulator [Acidimicrobiia bacterium]MDQ3501469.1 response regulator [Actinomycetota bacterium]